MKIIDNVSEKQLVSGFIFFFNYIGQTKLSPSPIQKTKWRHCSSHRRRRLRTYDLTSFSQTPCAADSSSNASHLRRSTDTGQSTLCGRRPLTRDGGKLCRFRCHRCRIVVLNKYNDRHYNYFFNFSFYNIYLR